MKTPAKVIVIVSSIALLAFGVYGSANIDQSFDQLVLGLKGSAYVKYFAYKDVAFPTGIPVSVVLDTPGSNYTDPTFQKQFADLSRIASENKYMKQDHYNWVQAMQYWGKERNISIADSRFYPALFLFLKDHPFFFVDINFKEQWMEKFQLWTQLRGLLVTRDNVDAVFEQFLKENQSLVASLIQQSEQAIDKNLTELFILSPEPLIKASRMMVFTKDNPHSIYRKDAMLSLREDLNTKTLLSVYGIGYFYIFVEQFVVILPDTIRNLAICACAILCITLPYLVDPKVTLFVFVGFVNLMFELFGVMYLWGVSLNAISMIVIVMGIGFSVDYSAHIAHAFVVSNEKTSELRVVHAMKTMGASVTMGGE